MVKKVIDSPAKFANSECIHSEQKLWMPKIGLMMSTGIELLSTSWEKV